MTWTLDYSVAFAIGSLFIALVGALIYYFGIIINDQIETEYNKIGYFRRFNTIKHYKAGFLFLSYCIFSFFLLSCFFFGIISVFYICIIFVYPSYNLFNEIFNNMSSIFAYDHVLLIAILVFSFGPVLGLEENSEHYIEIYLNRSMYVMITYPSIFALFVGGFFILKNILSYIDIFFSIILIFFSISCVACLYGNSIAREELHDNKSNKSVNRFVVSFTDGKKLDGQQLKYKDGVYTLKLDTSGSVDYIIFEDKIHYIERIYNSNDNGK